MGKEEALRLIKEAAETGATELDFTRQDLTELPPELFQIINLTSLDLSGNQITELPPEVFQMKHLTSLDLSFNHLNALPKQLFQMNNLTALGIGGLKLGTLPPELFQLTNLTKFDIRNNQLTELPPEIVQLINLKELYLSSNQFTEVPPEVLQLKHLAALAISDLRLTSLPSELFQLKNLTTLYLSMNHLFSPPDELVEQGIPAIREYFAEVEGETKEVAEVKVILVGEGAAGKTSLTRCLRGERFNPHEATTHGIRIKRWKLASSGREMCYNLWDFGGQEIMHATHQFFLSRRSLYVLVLDGRRDERPEYWLRYIESFGGGSPVLVVLNKWDANPGFDLNRPFLQEKYPFIVGFHRTSCCTGQGVEPFKQALLEELGNVPLSRNRWPAAWFRAKEMLEQMNEPRISYEKFEGICREAGVKGETTRKVLGTFLHDLGIVIHFEEFELDDNHVLDPKWVTGAVYKIINAPLLADANGLLRLDDLKQILQWQDGDNYRYWPADHVYIINLMQKFELCYELNDKEVLIPQLLGVSEPAFSFDYKASLRFELRYEDFLPPSVMPRFIVKRHHEIQDKLRWRTGVVLANPMLDATAVVRADNEARRIQIMVTGKDSKLFLALIGLTFRELHADFEGLKVSERLPLPDNLPVSVDYKSLLKSHEAGIEKVFPEGADKAYSVKDLLAGVHIESMGDQEKVLAMAKTDSKDGKLRWLAKKLNRYLEGEPELFGIKLKYQNIVEDVLNRPEE